MNRTERIALPHELSPENFVAPKKSIEIPPAEREIFEKTNIFLVGLPGSGKSTVGPEIAKITGMDFKDSDVLFYEWTKQDPNEYINRFGMAAFREKESAVLDLAVVNTNQVIATGGGIVETPKNVGLILKHGVAVYLEADLDVIAKRIIDDKNNSRAGLTGQSYEDVLKIITERYLKRYEAFQAAPIRIRVDNIGPRQIASIAKQGVLRRKAQPDPRITAY